MANIKEIKKYLSGYRNSDLASRQIASAKDAYKELRIANEHFTFPNGQRDNLARLKGTIPVSYRGTTYNIPIIVWLQKSFPQSNPIVFVTPTTDMCINTSRYVDGQGRVYLPYLTEWKQGNSDLLALIQILVTVFSENIPVYSRRQAPQQQPAPPTNYTSPSMNYGGYPMASRPAYPQHTPYPPQNPPYSRPPHHQPQPQPGYAPYPVGQPSAMPRPYGGPGYPVQSQPPQPHRPPQPPQPRPPQHTPYPQQSYAPGYPVQAMPHGAIAGAVAGGVAVATPVMSAEEQRRRDAEEEQLKRQSLETAVREKIQRQLQGVLDRAGEEMTILKTTQNSLQDNNKKLTDMLSEMDKAQQEADRNVETLTQKIAEMESIIDYLNSQPDKIDIDEAVTATNPVYNQILRLYAEENAIDDAIYYLGEALRKGVITHDVFLKNVRDLSRQQFLARATIMKARDAAKLPAYGDTT